MSERLCVLCVLMCYHQVEMRHLVVLFFHWLGCLHMLLEWMTIEPRQLPAWLAPAKLLTETLYLESDELRTMKTCSEFEFLGRKRHDGDVFFVSFCRMVAIASRHCFILCMAA